MTNSRFPAHPILMEALPSASAGLAQGDPRGAPAEGDGAVIVQLEGWQEARDLAEKIADRRLSYTADGWSAPRKEPNGGDGPHVAESEAIGFLHAFHGDAPWHLIAIGTDAKPNTKGDIKAASFHGVNCEKRALEWIEHWNNAGYNLYFAVNPLKTKGMARKANKNDVVAAEWLWSDIDPPKNVTPEQVEQWRAEQLADFEAGRPEALPPATFHVDSGRGFWRFWKLSEPVAVDGGGGAQTALVESYGRGIEQAFGSAADACRNIERIARLPGTINHKTGKRAAVLEHHPGRVYQLTDFPQAHDSEPEDPPQGPDPEREPVSKPFDLEALPAELRRTIVEGRYEDFGGDRSRAVYAAVCGLIRAGVSRGDIVQKVLLNRAFKISEHILDQKNPAAYAKRQADKAWEKGARPTESKLPPIQIYDGQLARAVDDAEDALVRANCPIMVRAQKLVMPVSTSYKTSHEGVETEIVSLKALTSANLAYMLTKHAAIFVKYNGRAKKCLPIEPPERMLTALLQKGQYDRIPQVVGVVSCPTLRPDGTILDQHGYDPATRLWHHLDPNLIMPPMPLRPTRKDAEAGLRLYQELLAGFSLATELDKAVALAAIISVGCRGAFSVGPMYLFNAFAAGEGKSYLVDLIAHIVTGRPCPVITLTGNKEEDEKRLGALLLEGLPIFSLDNCSANINSDLLCQIGSQTLIKVRILGRSEAPLCEWLGTLFATGNNVGLVNDMTRRGLTGHFNSNEERPELRKFAFDPIKKVLANRGLYIAAILTMVRAYLLSGERVDCPPVATFTDSGWSRIVRETLIWLGLPDVWNCTEQARAEDPARKAARELVRLWKEILGTDKSYRVHEIVTKASETRTVQTEPGWTKTHEEYMHSELRDFLLEQVGDKRGFGIDGTRFGYWLRQIKGQIHEGYRIVPDEVKGHHGQKWRLEPAG